MKGLQAIEKNVPRVFFEILLYGHNDNKKKVQKVKDDLQAQISKSRIAKNRVRILWYVDSGEMSVDEKKDWLIEKAVCKYYLIIDGSKSVSKTFVKDNLTKIRMFEKHFKSMTDANIKIAQKDKNIIETAEVIED